MLTSSTSVQWLESWFFNLQVLSSNSIEGLVYVGTTTTWLLVWRSYHVANWPRIQDDVAVNLVHMAIFSIFFSKFSLSKSMELKNIFQCNFNLYKTTKLQVQTIVLCCFGHNFNPWIYHIMLLQTLSVHLDDFI